MKKFFLIILAIFSANYILADVYKYHAYEVSFMDLEARNPDWSDWEDVNVLVVINTYTERVTIYSKTTQEYDIYEYGEEGYDKDGAKFFEVKCIDADGARCTLKVRTQTNGVQQIYINYRNLRIVYNIEQR